MKKMNAFSTKQLVLIFIGLFAIIVFLYWKILLAKTFINDDWYLFYGIERSGVLSSIINVFNPIGTYHYRPVGVTLIALLYYAFRLSPAPMHIFIFAIFALNGVLIVLIAEKLINNKCLAIMSAIILISLTAICIDTLYWIVGVFDIVSMFFILLSIILFIEQYSWQSAVSMLLAFLTKEAAVFVPVLLFVWAYVNKKELKTLRVHLIITVAYIIIKLLGGSALSLPDDHVYAMRISIIHIFHGIQSYFIWIISSFFPVKVGGFELFSKEKLLIFLIFFVIVIFWSILRLKNKTVSTKNIVFIVCWAVLAICPVLLLKNAASRYYAIHACIPFIIFFIIVIKEIFSILPSVSKYLMASLFATIIIMNVIDINYTFDSAKNEIIKYHAKDGKFQSSHRMAISEEIHNFLLTKHPIVQPNTVFVFKAFGLHIIGDSCAIRLQYEDSTLNIAREYDENNYKNRNVIFYKVNY